MKPDILTLHKPDILTLQRHGNAKLLRAGKDKCMMRDAGTKTECLSVFQTDWIEINQEEIQQ
jgi:hypothetical protein